MIFYQNVCTCLGEVYRWAKYVYYIAKRRELGKEEGITLKNNSHPTGKAGKKVSMALEFHYFAKRKYANF